MHSFKNKKIFLLDGYHFIFRAYFVNQDLTAPDGTPIGGVYGFTSMIMGIISDCNPEYMVVVFDTGSDNFRHKIYPKYKSHRPELPSNLKVQFPLVREVTKFLNINAIEIEGVEADDVIASLAHKFSTVSNEVIIVSSDKDLLQLINNVICIYDPIKKKYIREKETIEKLGVPPSQVRDFLSLTGDASDNIPGIPGIGPKTAIKLLEQFGSLNQILQNYTNITSLKYRKLVEDHRQLAELSWQLVGLKLELNLDLSFEDLRWSPPSVEQIQTLIQKFGFTSLITKASRVFKLELNHLITKQDSTKTSNISRIEITNSELLLQVNKNVQEDGYLAILLNKEKDNYLNIEISVGQDKLYFINLVAMPLENQDYIKTDSAWWKSLIIELLLDNSVRKITYNLKELLKFALNFLHTEITSASCIDDIMLMHYVLSAGKDEISLNEIIKAYNKSYSEQPENRVCWLKNTFDNLMSELFKNKLLHCYYEIDLPICYILYNTENNGIKINIPLLQELSAHLKQEIELLEQQIYQICGQQFNIASPKQLGEVLFNVLKLPHARVSQKTKAYSTDSEVLENLSRAGIKIAALLLRWRQLTKLLTTYIDTLPAQINNNTARVHTTLLQTSTATSRLSSQSPNLQNIPIRSEYGLKVRSAFCAPRGFKILSADYSQIELRILSHFANIQSLKNIFAMGGDIHSSTATQIFKINIDQVTAEHRRKAKAINFGIIYGISAFGLAKQLNISNTEAAQYINHYFQEYPAIKQYMDETKKFAAKHGYVQNMLDRRCYIPLINDSNSTKRHFAQRAAINAPIQSTAADIAKIAMIQYEKLIYSQYPMIKLLLQVHDELVFELPEELVGTACSLIKRVMENIPYFTFPLKVDIKVGDNWGEMEKLSFNN
ncbi:DNA polymerase I [Orientia chuto str. Dubai]|uniref:DNA polymerase I n=1 Tax=Orientia chuto str. Dubai TaxID=1359168 RepID=A0A0F3MHD2_9RICK|nr:DNA polymerase I [Candidatus Orientia mediorientalis]KJV55155.1 DNA polymerase I [Orientia chuto str. Dubai]